MVDLYPTIDEKAFRYIVEYKYVAGEYTYLDKKMGPFWGFVASLIPKVSVYLPQSLTEYLSERSHVLWNGFRSQWRRTLIIRRFDSN